MNKPQQSLANLKRAFSSLERSLASPPVEERDYAGIIKNFEFVYELTWNTLKSVLESEGISAPFPRIVFEEAFKRDLVEGNEVWKDIIKARNLSVHTYDPQQAHSLYQQIQDSYFAVFKATLGRIENFLKT